jgi:uncharacterized protein YndB with AHSA1/START domain
VTSSELRLSNLIEAPRDRVFRAITDAAEVDQWSTGGVPAGKARVEPRPDGAFSMGWNEGPDRVLRIEPERQLVLRWPRPQGDLRVTFDLEAKASGTAVYLTSIGYAKDESPRILHDRGGWSDLLVCLKNFIEGGEAGFANAYDAQVRDV